MSIKFFKRFMLHRIAFNLLLKFIQVTKIKDRGI